MDYISGLWVFLSDYACLGKNFRKIHHLGLHHSLSCRLFPGPVNESLLFPADLMTGPRILPSVWRLQAHSREKMHSSHLKLERKM